MFYAGVVQTGTIPLRLMLSLGPSDRSLAVAAGQRGSTLQSRNLLLYSCKTSINLTSSVELSLSAQRSALVLCTDDTRAHLLLTH